MYLTLFNVVPIHFRQFWISWTYETDFSIKVESPRPIFTIRLNFLNIIYNPDTLIRWWIKHTVIEFIHLFVWQKLWQIIQSVFLICPPLNISLSSNSRNFWLVHSIRLKFWQFLFQSFSQKLLKFEPNRMYQSKVTASWSQTYI